MKPSFLRPIIKSFASALLLSPALIALLSLILARMPDPSKFASLAGTAAVLAASLISGRIASADVESRLLCSLLTGIFTTLPLFLATLVLGELNGSAVIRFALCIICVMLGFSSKKSDTSAKTSAKKRKAIAKKYSV